MLRGINVSGKKMIKMDALRNMYSGIGFKNVQTYIQSGNVVFQEKIAKVQDLEKKISNEIMKTFGFEVPVLVQGLAEIKEIVRNNPFVRERKEEEKCLHVTFLSSVPLKENIEKINRSLYFPDEFIWKGKAVLLYCPGGYGKTKLTNTFFENRLKVTATTRNWKTCNELVSMADSLAV